MSITAENAEELAALRSRMQAALLDSSQPLTARIAEFHRLLRVSQFLRPGREATLRALEDSF